MTGKFDVWGLPRMDANENSFGLKPGTLRMSGRALRVAGSAALVSIMLSACSSVPDAINPVSWYEKTTDFFSGDSQAADTGTAPAETAQAPQNKGLSADPDAPPPAAPRPAEQVASAPSGLSADQSTGDYASPPIQRQGAAQDVYTPEAATASAPPPPVAAPQTAVRSQPITPSQPAPTFSAPRAPQTMPKSTDMASAPPPPSLPTVTGAPSAQPPFATATMTPPKPFEFPPVNSMAQFGQDEFETVVITADGMESVPEPQPQPLMRMPAAPQQTASVARSGAQFPQPGVTTSDEVGPVSLGGMLRVATIHFANNSSILDSRDRSILGAVIQLQRERGGRVVVVGHASSRTKDMDYIQHQMVNFEISMKRAGAIGSALKGMGLPGEALEVQAVSDTKPIFLEVMPSGEAGNRRVEIYLAGAAT